MALPQGPYNPKESEAEMLKFWLDNKFYKPEYNPKTDKVETTEEMKADARKPWALICPPPNAYARPHIGNISGYAYQDAMARYARMNGKKVLVLPGKDHAGLEGEGVFVREVLEKQGRYKFDMKREDFYNEMMEFFEKNMDIALKDEREIGLSADFDRNTFTLDPDIVETVLDTFVEMYKAGMIYKGVRIVNWDPKARSVIADNQCEREEREGTLYYIKYPIVDSSEFITVATTRPETMFGDTAVAFNPDDKRYKNLIGKKVRIPLTDIEIPIITSFRVLTDFGTGALKITPAHAQDDYQIMMEWNSQNPDNKISYRNVIGQDLKLTGAVPAKYKGRKYKEALPEIIEDLKQAGNYVKEEKIKQNILISERTKAIVEPVISSQWYLKYDKEDHNIKEAAMKMVQNGEVKIHPENMVQKFNHWMENLRDWAISRSLWWGYRLPVWYAGQISEEIDENGQVKEFIEINGKKEELDYSNPDHLRVQKLSPDINSINLILIPGKHGYAHKELYPTIKTKFKNTLEIRVNNIDSPSTNDYIEALKKIEFNQKDIVLAHSLGCRAIIRYILDNKLKLKHLILLAPGARLEGRKDGKDSKYLYLITSIKDYNKLSNLVEKITVIYSDDDPLASKEDFEKFILLLGDKAEGILEQGKGHYCEEKGTSDSKILDSILAPYSSELTNSIWHQDDNVLDTWFSSGQWVYAILSKYNLMDTFFPTNVLVSASDILENWDSRMMMFTYFKHKNIPFKNLFLTGLVLGKDGQKMSKSRGNIVDIDRVKDIFGTDSLRMAYFYQNSAGGSYVISDDKLKNFKQFNNKLWNASKFVLMNTENLKEFEGDESISKWSNELLQYIADLKIKITENIENYEFGYATETLYQEFWHTFCDKYIEESKVHLLNQSERMEVQSTLLYTLKEFIKMLHPFIPFITEKIWQEVPKNNYDHKSLMYTTW